MASFERFPGQRKSVRTTNGYTWKNRQLTLEQRKELQQLKKLKKKRLKNQKRITNDRNKKTWTSSC